MTIVIALIGKKTYFNFSKETGATQKLLNVFNDLLIPHYFTFGNTSTFLL